MTKRTQNVSNCLAVFAWLLVIYYFSNQPDLASNLEPSWDFLLRKLAHFAEYFVLTYLLFRAILGHNVKQRQAIIAAAVLSIGYALTDEWHQGFVVGRQASIKDVGVDSSGAALMGILLLWKK